MMPFTESSITLNFPDNNYFRLSEWDTYKKLQHIREMDFCWYDKNDDKLYLIELKDWGDASINEEDDPDISPEKIEEMKQGITKYRIKNLLEKSIDTLCIFSSILLNRPTGRSINNCAPFDITVNTEIILLSVINWNVPDFNYVSDINSAYRSRLNSYAKLFGVRKYHVITKKIAADMFEWIT